MQRQAKSRIKEELGFLLTMIGSILGTSVRLNIDGSYISKSSGLKEATITAGSDLILSCSLILKKIDPLEETELLWTVENRTLLYINDSGFNELVKSKALESANVSFWIPSYTPCPAPCQLADNNTDMMMMCRYGNVSDQVLLHILIPVASSLPWWFYLFPAWIAVIFILVLSNVLSYVFNQRLRLRLSLPPTPYVFPRYLQDIPKICPRYPQDTTKISPRYPQDTPKISPRYPQDIPKISPRYPMTSH